MTSQLERQSQCSAVTQPGEIPFWVYPVPAAGQSHPFPEPALDLSSPLLYFEFILLTPLWFRVTWLCPGGSATHLEQEQIVPNNLTAFCVFLFPREAVWQPTIIPARALGCLLSTGLCLLSLSTKRNWLFTCRAGISLPSTIEREARLVQGKKKMLLILSQYLQ